VPNASARDVLINELEDDGDSFFSGGFWNNIIDLSLTVLTVLASLVATVLATTDPKEISRWVVATVGGHPSGGRLSAANNRDSRAFQLVFFICGASESSCNKTEVCECARRRGVCKQERRT
jgi:hypothetical protein